MGNLLSILDHILIPLKILHHTDNVQDLKWIYVYF